MVYPGSRKSRRITLFSSQKTVHIASPADGYVLDIFLMGNSHFANPWTVVSIPARNVDTTSRHRWWCGPGNCHLQFHSGSAGPDRLAVVFMFPCQHPWEPLVKNYEIFQRCQHRFQLIEVDIQLRTQFPGCNPQICADELIEAIFVSWAAARNVACPSLRCRYCWNAPPTASLCSHPLFGLRKRLASVVEFQWVQLFPHGEFSDTPLLRTHFPVDAILPDCPSAAICQKAKNLWIISRKVQPLLPYDQHPRLRSWANVIK
jgi:hypothetical protein